VEDPLTGKPTEQRIWVGQRLHETPKPIWAKHFFGAHTFIDAEIGRLLAQIERTAPNALVIYTSDQGVFLDSHRLADKGPAMYDEITRVPFIVKWPGHTPANSVNDHLSHIDLAGSLMDFWGFDVPRTFEGGTMLVAFQDLRAAARSEVFIQWGRYEVDHDGFGGYQPIRCICDGRYKLSIHPMTSDELYDLSADPGEMHNLIDAPETAAVRDQLLEWMNTSRDPFRGYYWGRRSWRPGFLETWANAGMTRQRESDGYLPRELDYDTGLSNEERDPAEEDLEKDPRRRMALLDRSTACVFMAAVNARATGRTAAEYEDEVTKDIPLRRLARPEEIADGIVWLASERASYVNGQTILLVGGLYRGL
jgi:uncharacterized sulfatase